MTPIKHAEGFYTLGPVQAEGHADYEGKRLIGSGTVTLAFETKDASSTLQPADVLEVLRLHLAGTHAASYCQAAIDSLDDSLPPDDTFPARPPESESGIESAQKLRGKPGRKKAIQPEPEEEGAE